METIYPPSSIHSDPILRRAQDWVNATKFRHGGEFDKDRELFFVVGYDGCVYYNPDKHPEKQQSRPLPASIVPEFSPTPPSLSSNDFGGFVGRPVTQLSLVPRAPQSAQGNDLVISFETISNAVDQYSASQASAPATSQSAIQKKAPAMLKKEAAFQQKSQVSEMVTSLPKAARRKFVIRKTRNFETALIERPEGGRQRWTVDQERSMISLLATKWPILKAAKQNVKSRIYADIAEELGMITGLPVDGPQVMRKFNKIKGEWLAKRKTLKGEGGDPILWVHFNDMEKHFGDENVNPLSADDSVSVEGVGIQQEEEEERDEDDITKDEATTALAISAASTSTTSEKLRKQEDRALFEPYKHICRVKGKEIRSALIEAFDYWLKVPDSVKSTIKDMVEKLHNASLLIDDIEDNSKMRRGQPVAHSIFGVPLTINSANFVYFLALSKCDSLGSREADQACIEELMNLHRGQALDIYWRDSHICPTEQEYQYMVENKTGGLFRLALRVMQAFSQNKTNMIPLVNLLGFFFQLVDDYLNLTSEEYSANKSFCEDLTEGKFSFPVIHCIRSNPEDTRLQNILKQRTEDLALKKYALQVMLETDSLQYSRNTVATLRQQLHAAIATVGPNPLLASVVDKLAARTAPLDVSMASTSQSGASSRAEWHLVH